MLKRLKINNPTQQEKDDAAKKAVEEHHAILFVLGANKFKYGTLIEDMKNDIICKNDPFPKTVTDACHIISKWQNSYGKYNNGKNDSNENCHHDRDGGKGNEQEQKIRMRLLSYS